MLFSLADVMDSIWEDYTDGGRDVESTNWRKQWISLKKYGKNNEEFGFTIISSFLRRRFGFAPNQSIVVVFPLTKVNSLTSRQEAKKNKHIWDNGKGCM